MLSLTRSAAHCSNRRCDHSDSAGDRWRLLAREIRESASTSLTFIIISPGCLEYSFGLTPGQIAEIVAELNPGYEMGVLKPPPIEIVPFEKAVDGYTRVHARQAKAKQVISFD